ncbi:predicted protein [Nematostella vectensis]|uniref:Palmitoyltransferase n=1 Tax=Nematostella vectensis TaxID=45351 RepID=A7SIV7_NEMVE|nr:predicted protein [Nematostella vectensis]|eukprot:XP_001628411.1 predicted protein [Nematostella vectensis]
MASDASPLCCCEYKNIKGERTHLLALCCDCEDLDNAVDQCLKGKKVPFTRCSVIHNVITDRLRIPWPKGAKKLNMEFVIPVVLLPSSLYFASRNFIFTVLSLVYLPLFVFVYYVYSLRTRKRTWFFVSWASTSVIGIYVVFLIHISSALHLQSTVFVTLGTIATIYFYYRVINSETKLNLFAEVSDQVERQNTDNGKLNNGVKSYERLTCCFCTYGPFHRSKHCRICGYCVPRSDHHCVWTNCCIGHHNQGKFLLAILSFVMTGGWGIHLSLSTICKPVTNAWAALMFVCTFYGVVFVLAMSMLLAQQLVFISLNITGDEWRRSPRSKSLLQVLRTNPHYKGFLQNWKDFLFLKRDKGLKARYELV